MPTDEYGGGDLGAGVAVVCQHLVAVAGGVAVVDQGEQSTCLHLQAPPSVGGSQGGEQGVARGIGEVGERGVEVVPLVVDAHI